ncbi:MAG TPA: CapA family protein [bacterium]|nr:CapA family protein [bacterium]
MRWKLRARVLVLAAVLLMAAGCARPKKPGEAPVLVFSAAGEVRPTAGGQSLFADRKGQGVLADVKSSFLSRDLVMADLAAGFDQGCQPLRGDESLRWSPEWMPLLSAANLKVLMLADDHALDCGREALSLGMNAMLAQGFYLTGASRNQKEAGSPVFLTSKGITVSLLSFLTQPVPGVDECRDCAGPAIYDRTSLINSLAEMKDRANYHVLCLHFAERELPRLSDQELTVAKEGIDYGADLVIGYGPASAGGIYRIRGTWVVGSMGRLTGDAADAPLKSADGFILSAEFAPDKIMNLRLAAVELQDGKPVLLRGDPGTRALADVVAKADAEVKDNVKLIGDILYLR